MNNDATGFGIIGLSFVAALGLVLLRVSLYLRSRSKGKVDIKAADVLLAILPALIWLIATGKLGRFAFAGLEIETAFITASQEPVSGQISEIAGIAGIVEAVTAEERSAKGAPSRIPELIKKRIEALEFRLGRENYYVGSAIEEHIARLLPYSFFRYIVIYRPNGTLFGLLQKEDVAGYLGAPPDRYKAFADQLNSSEASAHEALKEMPGFLPGDSAISPETNKRAALQRMEEFRSDILPVVDPGRGFVGVVDRTRLTAGLILDITKSLEREGYDTTGFEASPRASGRQLATRTRANHGHG